MKVEFKASVGNKPQVSQLVSRVERRGKVLQSIHVVRSLHLIHQEPHLDLHKTNTHSVLHMCI